MLVRAGTRQASAPGLGVFTSFARNVLHFLVHLNFRLSKVQAESKNTNKLWGPRLCRTTTGVQPELAGHMLSVHGHVGPGVPAAAGHRGPGRRGQ